MSQAYDQRLIRSARLWLEHVLESTRRKLATLEAECTHPDKAHKHQEGGLGFDGYSTYREVYTRFTCQDCGKIWNEPGY
jgi:hypothetical protein